MIVSIHRDGSGTTSLQKHKRDILAVYEFKWEGSWCVSGSGGSSQVIAAVLIFVVMMKVHMFMSMEQKHAQQINKLNRLLQCTIQLWRFNFYMPIPTQRTFHHEKALNRFNDNSETQSDQEYTIHKGS
jgi:hypothetical protein